MGKVVGGGKRERVIGDYSSADANVNTVLRR